MVSGKIRTVGVAACFALSATAVAANEAGIASPEEGFWGGGFRSSDGASIQFSLTNVDGIGELEVEARRWQGLAGVYNCTYVFDIENGAMGDMFLNEAQSFNSTECLPVFPMSFERSAADVLTVTFEPRLGSLIGLPTAQLSAVLRPIREEDRLNAEVPLDILGVSPGMSRTEIAEILEGRGYSLTYDEPEAYSAAHYTIPMERWTVSELVSEAEPYSGSPRDEISVVYTSTKPWLDQEPQAVSVTRGLIPAPADGLTISRFLTAVQQKYGGQMSDYGGNVVYGRGGQPVRNARECGEGSLQAIDVAGATLSERGGLSVSGMSFSPYCAGSVNVSLRSDRATGLLTFAILSIGTSDMAWQEFWQNWSRGRYTQIETVLSALSGGGEGPEL